LFVASPAIQSILVYLTVQSEFFSELWLLGPDKTTTGYPHNILSDKNYTVYLGVANQLGSFAYYTVKVKFCNSTQDSPNNMNDTDSSQQPLYTMNLFVPNTGNLEIPITFSFNYSYSYDEDVPKVNFNQLTFNELPLSLHGYSITLDTQKYTFSGKIGRAHV
jgi:uncharacterized membrane protein